MFSQSSRIQKGDIVRIMKEWVSYHSPSFSLKVLKNSSNKPLFAVVISKKVAKTAVSRNKNKRRVREVVKKYSQQIPQNNFYIVTIKKDLNKNVFQDLLSEMKDVLAKVR